MQRPTAVTVFGILNIVFAAFGIFGAMASVMLFVAMGHESQNPAVQALQNNPGYAMYMKLSALLGIVVCAALLAAGIGLLKLQPWARMLSIAYGIFGLVSVPVNSVLSFLFITRPMLEQMQQHGSDAAAKGAAVGGLVGGMAGGCLGIIYPLLLLIFMLRPKIAAAFKPSVENPPAN